MRLDLERVRANVRAASTEDLLDRATVYRAGLEPEALALIDEELRGRGVGPADLERHAAGRERSLVLGPDGLPVRCCRCARPATVQVRGWQRLWGLMPVFPRRLAYCDEHRPARAEVPR
jgi:hypothetical protein